MNNNKPPFLMNFTKKDISLSNLGGGLDFRRHMVDILGFENLNELHDNSDTLLILTRIHDQEADMIGLELANKGVNYIRINIDEFPYNYKINFTYSDSFEIEFCIDGPDFKKLKLSDISLIWFRRFRDFEAFGFNESDKLANKYVLNEWKYFFKALMNLTSATWINHPYNENKLSKLFQLKLAAQCGLIVPKTLISNDPTKISEFYYENNKEIIAKSMFSHYIEDDGKLHAVFGRKLQEDDLELLESASYVPCIYQQFIEGSQEVRVTVIKDKVFSAIIPTKDSTDDWHRDEMKEVKLVPLDLPDDVANKCVEMLKKANLEYGAFDFMITKEGSYIFLEVNPTGDWRWVEICTNQPITEIMINHMISKLQQKSKYQII